MSDIKSYIGFPTSDNLKSHINNFLEAAEAGDRKTGERFVALIDVLTQEVIDALLLQTIEIAQLNSVSIKIINVCASTANKVSGALTSKIYRKAPIKELQGVANVWEAFLKNTEKDNSGDWYILTQIDENFAAEIDAILAEKGDSPEYDPKDREYAISIYDRLMDLIIQQFFLEASNQVKMGAITNKMLNVGVDSVKGAIHAVLHKVVKRLEPLPLGRYVEHTTQFYIKLDH
ncbi:MAG: hypothetical protein MI867_21560 [Pseudomonadales bacterium]|nr:hypothetical protein [Pseudomonadales bacterium]